MGANGCISFIYRLDSNNKHLCRQPRGRDCKKCLDPYDLANLESLCKPCHSAETNARQAEERKQNRI